MNIKGSKTEKNLLAAFAGESQARNRYSYFATAAKNEGYVQIALAFEETSAQEKQHAKRFFKFLEGGDLSITATFPAGTIADTKTNLKASAAGEHHEWGSLYPDFAKIAREEGFEPVARTFEAISVAEKQHEARYLGFLKNLEQGTVFKKDKKIRWRCLECGYVHEGEGAPENCPACAHPKAYFEMLGENW